MVRPGIEVRSALKRWLPLAIAITLTCGLVSLAVQQEIRLSANDPQIGMAEDLAAALSHGLSAQGLLSPQTVDIAASLSTFLVVHNSSRQPVASTGLLILTLAAVVALMTARPRREP